MLCSLLSSRHPCWCLAPVQEAASHPHSAARRARPALQMPSSSIQCATEGLPVQSPFAVFSPSGSGCLHCQPCVSRLATALSAGGNKADSSGGMWSEWARELRPEASLQISEFPTGQMTDLGSISLLGLFNLFPVPLENGELWISCSMFQSLRRWNQKKNVF